MNMMQAFEYVSAGQFTEAATEQFSQVSTVKAIHEILGYYELRKEEREEQQRSLVEATILRIVTALESEEVTDTKFGITSSISRIRKVLVLAGTTVVKYVLKPAFKAIARLILHSARWLVRGAIQVILRPLLVGAMGFLATPLGAGLAVAGGAVALGYWLWNRSVGRSDTMPYATHADETQANIFDAIDHQDPSVLKRQEVYDDKYATSDYGLQDAATQGFGPDADKGTGPKLGFIAQREESAGKGVGTISTGRGDHGGVSYGAHQLASNNGSMARFLASPEGKVYASHFSGTSPGSKEFNERYKQLVAHDGQGMAKAQYEYIRRTHFDVQCRLIYSKTGIDVRSRSKALQEAIFSLAVQYGARTNAAVKAWNQLGPNASDQLLIDTLYGYKANTVEQYFASSDEATRASIRRRVAREHKMVTSYGQQTQMASSDPTMRPSESKDEEQKVAQEQGAKQGGGGAVGSIASSQQSLLRVGNKMYSVQ